MMNWFVKNETGSKFWLTEITWPTPDGIPNTLKINRPKFQESLHWHNGQTSAVFMSRYTVA